MTQTLIHTNCQASTTCAKPAKIRLFRKTILKAILKALLNYRQHKMLSKQYSLNLVKKFRSQILLIHDSSMNLSQGNCHKGSSLVLTYHNLLS